MGQKNKGAEFIHLRTHSAYSLLEGALKIPELVDLVTRNKMPALAVTDRNNLFGALEFSEKMRAAGIQPIIGCTLSVQLTEVDDDNGFGGHAGAGNGSDRADSQMASLALIAKDRVGYGNLMELSSRAFLDNGDSQVPHVGRAFLEAHSEGLIALTGGPEGPVDKALLDGQQDLAEGLLKDLLMMFGNRLYVELQRHGGVRGGPVERRLLKLAYDCDVPIVATNQCFFKGPGDFEAHDALICIAEGTYVTEDERRRLTPEHYFKAPGEMVRLFKDIPEALENTVEIAKRCAYCPQTHPPILPQFVTGKKDLSDQEILELEARELTAQAEAGLKARLKDYEFPEDVNEKDYWDRLAYELEIIISMKFPGYFLIVADFIKWSKDHDIPVGPGRGSGAGSVVAWVLTITDLDPLRFGLLFERFLNPERVSMPDFDIDFCQDRRDEVIGYVQDKYGADRVAQIITFGKLQARAVLRDVGRVLQMPYGQVDRLCKLVPNNPANPVTLEEAINEEPQFREAARDDKLVDRMLDIGKKLEGLYRHASTHAAGVVIGDRPLTELVPLYQDPRSPIPATQFNMKWVEPAGLVKFDFLGLKTLTVIHNAIKLMKANGASVDFDAVGLDDKKTYELLARADTVGVFQLESTGMRESLRKLSPDRFGDIIAMVALYRPGPMDNIPTYIARKKGEEDVDYLHPKLKHLLDETYGVIIYQEQVMQIAQILSGYSLGDADLLRRAMGKKIKSEMAEQKTRFVDGAVKNEVDKKQAQSIFELVDKFAGYGFNKSHAAAYAVLAYQTAYLKANHPVEFLAASMSLDMGNTEKLNVFAQEARSNDIEVLPPSVNHSWPDFATEGRGIRYALTALKNVGRSGVEHIVEEREANGAYENLADFAGRINPKLVNKRALETLAAAGAFDDIHANRAEVLGNVDIIAAQAQRMAADRIAGQNDLFASDGGGDGGTPLDLKKIKRWLPSEQLSHEFDAVGFFLSGHPLDEYMDALQQLGVQSWSDFDQKSTASGGLLAGTAISVKERKSARGNRYAFVSFSDATGQFETLLFSDALDLARDYLEDGSPVLIRVEAERDGETTKLRALSVEPLSRAVRALQKDMTLSVEGTADWPGLADALSQKGSSQLQLRLILHDCGREIEMSMPGKYDLSPERRTLIKHVAGVMDLVEQ